MDTKWIFSILITLLLWNHTALEINLFISLVEIPVFLSLGNLDISPVSIYIVCGTEQIYVTFYPCVMFKHTVHQMVHFTLLKYMLLSTHVLCSNTLFIKWFISPCSNICYFLPMCYVQTHCSSNGSFHLAQIYVTFYPCVMFKHTVHQMVHFTLLKYMLLSTHVLCSNTLFIKWFISPCSNICYFLPMCYVQTHCSSNGSFHLAQIYVTIYPCVMFKHTVHQMVHFTLLKYMLLSTHVLCSNTLFIKWFISPCSNICYFLPMCYVQTHCSSNGSFHLAQLYVTFYPCVMFKHTVHQMVHFTLLIIYSYVAFCFIK